MFYEKKPIKPNDINNIRKHALKYMVNGNVISIVDYDDVNDNANLIIYPYMFYHCVCPIFF